MENGKIAHKLSFPNIDSNTPRNVATNAVTKTKVLILKRGITLIIAGWMESILSGNRRSFEALKGNTPAMASNLTD